MSGGWRRHLLRRHAWAGDRCLRHPPTAIAAPTRKAAGHQSPPSFVDVDNARVAGGTTRISRTSTPPLGRPEQRLGRLAAVIQSAARHGFPERLPLHVWVPHVGLWGRFQHSTSQSTLGPDGKGLNPVGSMNALSRRHVSIRPGARAA